MKHIVKDDNLTFEEAKLAKLLREEILKSSQDYVEPKKTNNLSELELISTHEIKEQEYVSPIFSMNEDEILAFVEEFEVGELATLSNEELNHIGKVLGVDPKMLVE